MELFNGLLDELTHSGCDLEAGWCRPLISYMRDQQLHHPPYVPQWDLLPLHKLAQLALLWKAAGFTQEAGHLAHWLAPLTPFPSFWCPEKEFNLAQATRWLSRLSAIEPIPCPSPDFGLTLFSSPSLSAAFTLAGNGTSLGVLRAEEIEIRAMGPQSPSLAFGIQGRGEQGWARCSALPEVWFQSKAACRENECQIDLRFVGLTPETPLEFAFYVKAPHCQVGDHTFRPKSLNRFHGEATTLLFGPLQIESSLPRKVRIIPLAGEGCFWDTEFLAAFEIPPIDPQLRFTINAKR